MDCRENWIYPGLRVQFFRMACFCVIGVSHESPRLQGIRIGQKSRHRGKGTIPHPAPSEVLVEVRAAGLNFPDLLVVSGTYQVRTPPPFVPGAEAAGVVLEVGARVSRFSPGDRVIVMPSLGAFAEKCVVHQANCMPLPGAMDFEQGAGFTVTYATTYHAFRQSAPLKGGETVLVLGAAGGVGSAAVEIATALGATVIAAASSEEKLEFARQCGAEHLINYSDTSLRDAIREITGKKGVDIVYDPVGGELAVQALRSLGWHGRHLVVGFASGDIPSFPANLALLKEAQIIGVWWGTWSHRNPDRALSNLEELSGMLARGELKPRVTASYSLEDFEAAFDDIAQRRAMGKIVLLP